ncbi:MAG: DoxX family protein [Acidobacteriaceae bacterium]
MPVRYVLPIALLIVTLLAFLLAGRRGYATMGWLQPILRVLVAIPLLVSGVYLHFLHPDMVASIIPPIFPAHYFLAVFTGVCEVAGAIGLFPPSTRRPAALWLALLMIAVFPANIYVAGHTINGLHMPSVPVRTTMQWVYLVMILLAGYGFPKAGPAAQTR